MIILALTVYFSNSRSKTNVYLSWFILGGLFWVFTNLLTNLYLTNNNFVQGLLFTRLALVGASILPVAFLFFAMAFVGKEQRMSKLSKAGYMTPILLLLLTTFTDYNAKIIDKDVVTGQAYYLIILIFISYFLYGTILLAQHYKNADAQVRTQLKFIFLGIILSVVPGLVVNGILPAMGNTSLSYYGSAVVIFFAFFTSIAIIKHQLFNVRAAIARTVAYGLFVSFLSAVYIAIIFILSSKLVGAGSVFVKQVAPIATAIFLVFTAPYFKRIFDRITNRLFYQDAYDTQGLLDDFNKALLDNIELPILLRHATSVIQENLKSQFCTVIVNTEGPALIRNIGTADLHFSGVQLAQLRLGLADENFKIVVEDFNSEDSHIKRLLKSKNVALAIRLDASYRTGKDSLAYLMLGPKRNGGPYSKKDLKIIEIIADELVIAIQNALRFEEIQGFASTLQENVNEATAKLKHTNEKLKEMDQTKDEFISMASHQLRTPLTSVKGYLSMVLEGDVGKVTPEQEKLLNQAFISSQRMVYLIADLLNVSRLKTGKFVIVSAPTDLAEVVQGEIDQLTEVAKGKNIKINYKRPKEFTKLMLDETKIRQVIMNFIDNAIYYTPAKGNITVIVKEDRGNVYFSVKDNGMGVPKEDQKHLFTKFYRGTNARKARPDGTGLGLFMAKKVVSAQDGNILFESREGKGSTFGFSFSKSKLRVEDKQG